MESQPQNPESHNVMKDQYELWYRHAKEWLTLKAPTTTVADEKFCDIFPNFRTKIRWYFMRNLCHQTIFMKYQAFLIIENAAKFETVVCCKL